MNTGRQGQSLFRSSCLREHIPWLWVLLAKVALTQDGGCDIIHPGSHRSFDGGGLCERSGLLGVLRTQDISHAAGAGHILTQLAVIIRDFSWIGKKVSELN